MKVVASLRAPELSKTGLLPVAIIVAALLAIPSTATAFMAQRQLLATGQLARRISGKSDASIRFNPATLHDQALEYMLNHPPRAYGHGAEVDAENKRLAEENRRLYEGMGRLELVMNYLAESCSAMHPGHDAICDGRAMLLLYQLQQQHSTLARF